MPTSRMPLRLLFIGNSYTCAHNLPVLLACLAEAGAGSPLIEPQQVTDGGWTLDQHWEAGTALRKLHNGQWDYVVLQEQSQRPIRNPAAMARPARLFDTEIRRAGAQTLLYLTWARRDRPDDQAALDDAYLGLARELDARVAPVGIAWQKALQKNPSLRLHVEDNSHPNPAGSYLAALVFLAILLGTLPESLPTTVTALPEADLDKQRPLDVEIDVRELPMLRRAALASLEELRR